MIQIKNLVFEYPGKRVLHNISFTIAPQTICALVGPNGAGKTTLLRCISSLHHPFSGTVHVNGINVHHQPRECHKHIAYLTDFFGLYEKLTIQQSLQYMVQAYGIKKSHQKEAIEWVLHRLDLNQHIKKKASELSRGLRQRLGIAYAIIHKPSLILLDEPASGLDPEARRSLSELLLDLKNDGMTIVVSSHILAELEEYSDEMLIIREGQIIEQKHPQQLHDKEISITIKTDSDPQAIVSYIQQRPDCHLFSSANEEIVITLPGNNTLISELLNDLTRQDFKIIEYYKTKKSMHDIYMQTVNQG